MRRIFYTFILKNCSLILFLTARVASADHAPHGFKDLRLCEYPPRTGGKLPVGEDNCLTAYHNGGILHRVLQSIRLLCLMGKTFFCEVFKGYFFLPPSAPVTPCVDSCKAYDGFAKAVERIHDVFLVCLCARHK